MHTKSKIQQILERQTHININGVEYVNSITFDMEPADVKNIRFYKLY